MREEESQTEEGEGGWEICARDVIALTFPGYIFPDV